MSILERIKRLFSGKQSQEERCQIFGSGAMVLPPEIPTINIVDRSTMLQDSDFMAMVEAVKIQFEKHVAPFWMKGAWNIVVNQPESVGFPIVILDDPDQAGMLGYHTESPNGKVWARVFVKAVMSRKGSMLSGPLSVSVVLSHEVMEAFCNPNVNLWAKSGDGKLIAYEVADPVENDCYDIQISDGRNVSVSNFVLPAWFDPCPLPDSKFDYMGNVKKSFTMSKGGYMVMMDMRTGQIKNVFGSKIAKSLHEQRQEPHVAARSNRMISYIHENLVEIVDDDD